jgi:hypothetical protein
MHVCGVRIAILVVDSDQVLLSDEQGGCVGCHFVAWYIVKKILVENKKRDMKIKQYMHILLFLKSNVVVSYVHRYIHIL